jgi:hypothetical protein
MSQTWIDYMGRAADDASAITESEDKWALLTISVPEARRADRHAIRTLLEA